MAWGFESHAAPSAFAGMGGGGPLGIGERGGGENMWLQPSQDDGLLSSSCRLTDALGPAFGLISREAQSKISIMQWHQQGPQGPHYHTVQSMVDFELASGLVGFRSLPARLPPSGCRTLLRLHRTLKWLELFLRRLGASREDESPSRMCAEAYRLALAPYHSWWVRQGAALAFLALPSRRELYHTILRAEQLAAGALVLTTVESLGRVYNVTQEVYSAHGMLDLP
ncbi:ceramide-1-phosphate transfer protein-like [Notechis scutatus]|uniref:Ceramide-1-phosphate transfer protein-like n=1 Tax=Notechis scutatus TaxID=8663 RepID=A0A6J1WCI3_9SAUR|nr:ceramide-1-phosphate transfer protein-like [Notechis scutatus]